MAFNDLPLQVEENDIPRRLGASVDVVMIAGHRESFASGGGRVYSVVEEAGYCIQVAPPLAESRRRGKRPIRTWHEAQRRYICVVDTVTLFRPVGPEELELIKASGHRVFPPPLPNQPIFYPVTNHAYATKIARDYSAVPASPRAELAADLKVV